MAYAMLANFQMVFMLMDGKLLKELFTLYIRLKLEWNIHWLCLVCALMNVDNIEKVQGSITKWFAKTRKKLQKKGKIFISALIG